MQNKVTVTKNITKHFSNIILNALGLTIHDHNK